MSYKIKRDLTDTNKGAKGANKPQWLVVHFVGATGQAQANANYFKNTYRGSSAHYFLDPGNIIQVVEDDRPAWHVGDGSRSRKGKYNGYHGYGATNNNSIGIELCLDVNSHSSVWNMRFHPETLNRAVWLIKQKQKQYNIPDERVIRHFDVSGKLCPGNWQHNNWEKWWEFKDRLAGVKASKPSGTVSKDDGKPTDIDKLARETIAGKHGNGDARKRSLGSNYNKVMQRVNELLGVTNRPAPKPKSKSIDTLVKETLAGKHGNGDARKKSLGSNYNAVMAVINGKVAPTPKPQVKSIDTLVKETLAGKHGNGDARKRSLGSNYQAVMDVINGRSSTRRSNTITNRLINDVIAGKYGNGKDRERRLRNAGYDPQAVQREVNKRF